MASGFARDSALNAIAGLSTTIGGVLSTVLVARLLGVEGSGVVAFATFVVTVAVVLTDLGLAGALARYLPELRMRGENDAASALTRYLLVRLLIVLAAMAACFAVYAASVSWRHPSPLPVRADTYSSSVAFWIIVGSTCLVQGLAAFFYGYLKGTQAFGRLATLMAAGGALQVAATLIGGWFFGLAGALTGALLGHLIPACLVVTMAAGTRTVSPELKGRVNRFALESWGSYLVTAFAWSRMEIFFLELSWGPDAAGLFAVSLTLANLATQAPMLLTGALLPYLSQHATGPTAGKAREAYGAGMRLMAFIVFPASFGVAAIAPRLMPTLFGAEFTPAVPTAMILVSAAAFSSSASVALTYLFAMERTRVVLATGALGAVLSILVGLTLVPLYGPTAAAIGRGAIQLMVVAAAVWYIDRRLKVRAPYGSLGRLMAAALICGMTAFLVLMAIPGLAGLAAAISAGAIAYVVAVKVLKGLPPDDVERLVAAAHAVLPHVLRGPAVAVLRFF